MSFSQMFATIREFTELEPNGINLIGDANSANGLTGNTVIDSNDEPAGNNQQRMLARGY